jgi:hypothetical protein
MNRSTDTQGHPVAVTGLMFHRVIGVERRNHLGISGVEQLNNCSML